MLKNCILIIYSRKYTSYFIHKALEDAGLEITLYGKERFKEKDLFRKTLPQKALLLAHLNNKESLENLKNLIYIPVLNS